MITGFRFAFFLAIYNAYEIPGITHGKKQSKKKKCRLISILHAMKLGAKTKIIAHHITYTYYDNSYDSRMHLFNTTAV